MNSSRSRAKFIGRRAELGRLTDAFDRCRSNDAQTIFVAGDAGVGKSRLVAEFADLVEQRGGRVLFGGCPPMQDALLPFAPISEAFRAYIHHYQAHELDEALRDAEAIIGGTGPDSLGPGVSSVKGSSRARLFESMVEAIHITATQAPTFFVVEDLHWADISTLDFLTYLIRNMWFKNLLLVGTYRRDDVPPLHPLRSFLAELVHSRRIETIELEPFTRDEVMAQLADLQEVPPPRATVDLVMTRSEGNPLYVEEIARLPNQTGVPRTIQDLLMVRLRPLSTEGQEVLRLIAVAGMSAKHVLLESISRLSERQLQDGLREVIDSQFLSVDADSESYSFRHPLIREVVYSSLLLPGERTRLHGELAEAFISSPGMASGTEATLAAELAFHLYRAHRIPEAFEASVQAAGAAWDCYAFAEAFSHFERALELWDLVDNPDGRAGTDRVDLMSRAAEAAYLRGDPGKASEVMSAAIQRLGLDADPRRDALLHERLGLYLYDEGRVEAGLEARQTAVRKMPKEPVGPELARVMEAEARMLMFVSRFELSKQRAHEALMVARSAGARREEGRALNTLGVSLVMLGRVDAGLEKLYQALDIGERDADAEAVMSAYNNLGRLLEMTGRLEEAASTYESGIAEVLKTRRASRDLTYLRRNYENVLLRLGRLDTAKDLMERHVPSTTEGTPALLWNVVAGQLAYIRGDFEIAESHLRRVGDVYLESGDPEVIAICASALGECSYWRGDIQRAADFVRAAVNGVGADQETFEAARFYAVAIRIQAEIARLARARQMPDDEHAAVDRTRRLLAESRRLRSAANTDGYAIFPEVVAWGLAAEAESLRASGVLDAESWARAETEWSKIGQPFEQAYACWRHAESCIAHNDRGRAIRSLHRAKELASHLKAAPLLQRVSTLAEVSRIPLRAGSGDKEVNNPNAAASALTPRESEILGQLGHGMSNRQIAADLGISHRTVEVHVKHICEKLSASSRVEAASFAFDLGLVEKRE